MIHLLTETKPAYFLQKPRFLTSQPLPKYHGEFFSTTLGDFARKGGRVFRDTGTGQKARQEVSKDKPLHYKRARDVQPETPGEPLHTRVMTGQMVYPYRLRLRAEVAPVGGEVTR